MTCYCEKGLIVLYFPITLFLIVLSISSYILLRRNEKKEKQRALTLCFYVCFLLLLTFLMVNTLFTHYYTSLKPYLTPFNAKNCHAEMNENIDVVIPWVNSITDETWTSKKEKYLGNETNDNTRLPTKGDPELELRESLRLIHKNLKFIKKTFIVTMRPQVPTCLETFISMGMNVYVVHHDEFIPPSLLPTFNALVIERYLNKILPLSEKFIYFNDDIYTIKKLNPDYFFTCDSKPIIRLNPFLSMALSYNLPTSASKYASACRKTLKKSKFPVIANDHGPQALTKSMFDILNEEQIKIMANKGLYRFRHKDDFVALNFLFNEHLKRKNVIAYKNSILTHTTSFFESPPLTTQICSDAKVICINSLDQNKIKDLKRFKMLMQKY